MVVTPAMSLPKVALLCTRSWIGHGPTRLRSTNQAISRKSYFHVESFDNHHSDSFGLEQKSKISRRAWLLVTMGINTTFSVIDSTSAGPFPSMKEPDIPRYYTTQSGVKIQDVVEGDGPAAHEGDIVELNYVCRRSNGYFVYSTVDQLTGESKPVILPLDEKQIIAGLKEVLVGMKAGGKRRALIPPDAGFISEALEPQPQEFGPRRSLSSHMKEPLVFEVQVLKVL